MAEAGKQGREGVADLPEGFKMTELGPLPEEWEVVRLGEVSKVITGRTPSTTRPEFWDGSIPFITPVDLNGGLMRRAQRTITEEGLRQAKPLPKGAILVSCIGYIGKVGVVGTEIAVTNQQINAIIPKTKVDNWFLAYTMLHEAALLATRARMTTVPILHKTNFERVPIPLPPLQEQRAIANVLRTVQRAKEATERVIQATRELKKSLMRHLFTYGPVPIEEAERIPLKETEVGPVPEHWEVTVLGKVIIKAQYGLSLRGSIHHGKYPILRMNNLQNGTVNICDLQYVDLDEELLSRFKLNKGDLLFNRTNSHELVGKTALFETVAKPPEAQNHQLDLSA